MRRVHIYNITHTQRDNFEIDEKFEIFYNLIKKSGEVNLQDNRDIFVFKYDHENDLLHPYTGDFKGDNVFPRTSRQLYDSFRKNVNNSIIIKYCKPYKEVEEIQSEIKYQLDYVRILKTLEKNNMIELIKDEEFCMTFTDFKFRLKNTDNLVLREMEVELEVSKDDFGNDWYSADCLGTSLHQDLTEYIKNLYTNLKHKDHIIVEMDVLKKYDKILSDINDTIREILSDQAKLMATLNDQSAPCLSELRKIFNIDSSRILSECKKHAQSFLEDPEKIKKELNDIFVEEDEGLKVNPNAKYLYEVWAGDIYGETGIKSFELVLKDMRDAHKNIKNFEKFMINIFKGIKN